MTTSEVSSSSDEPAPQVKADATEGGEASSFNSSSNNSRLTTILKLMASSALLYSAISTFQQQPASSSTATARRRLMNVVGDALPSYMDPLMKDLRERKKLFDDTPPEEVKYWFEYTGPLQVSKSVCCLWISYSYISLLNLWDKYVLTLNLHFFILNDQIILYLHK